MKLNRFFAPVIVLMYVVSPVAADDLTGTAIVKDARTLVVNGETLQLFGIDAVAPTQTCQTKRKKDFPCGVVAANALATVVRNVEVRCNVVSPAPPVITATCLAGPMDIAEQQVLLGWAFADPETGEKYRRAERAARVLNEGIWKGHFEYPWDWRKQHR